MKILLYAKSFYPNVGGVQTVTRLIAEYLLLQGADVIVATLSSMRGEKLLPFHVEYRPSRRKIRFLVEWCDLVFMNSFNIHVFISALSRKKKLAVTYHDLTPVCPLGTKWRVDRPCLEKASIKICPPCLKSSGEQKILVRLLRPLTKSLLSLFIDANICPSNYTLDRFPLWKKHLIMNGVDTSFFVPASLMKRNTLPTVVFVGRLVPEKGCQILLEALRVSLDSGIPFHINICGDGPYAPHLKDFVQSQELTSFVAFQGVAQGEALLNTLHISDVAVVPSLWDEPFGLTAIEAMSCGLPVIAADVGGLGDIVREFGLVFPRGDARALALHLQRLFANPNLCQQMGNIAHQLAVEKYDSTTMSEKYYRLFLKMTNTNHNVESLSHSFR